MQPPNEAMNVHPDELDPPFEILEPAEPRGPVAFNSPHSGCVYPKAFLAGVRLDLAALRRSEDCFRAPCTASPRPAAPAPATAHAASIFPTH